MKRGVYSVYYDDIMIDFRKKYDPDDDLWFMKHAKLEYSDNGEEVYAALKHPNEVRDNVSIKYDDYIAATEQVKNSLRRAALDIINDSKAVDEAFEAIGKIQTKLLDDYPFNQKRDTIQKDNGITQNTKDTHAKPNTNNTEKENNSTDNKHEATQRESGADTEWITSRTSNNPQENKDTETTLKRDNGISNEYAPSSKEMAQEWNEKANEKEIYEMTLAIAAATLKPMLILAETHKDIMLESDLMRLTTSDISMMETMIGLTQGLEYTEMYL